MRRWQAAPWRFGAADYQSAVAAAPPRAPDPGAAPVVADWDAALAPLMQTHGLAIAEEAVAESLLDELACRTAA